MIEPTARLRPIPYPYRAMLAICSDLDETPDRHVYYTILRFLNTTQATPMGRGVGLEVANSLYFDMPADQFAYWNTDEAGRRMIQTLIHSGHIDCLHSFGDQATTRTRAAVALDELCRHNCRLQVWVDHATAPTNFGPDIMRGHGDRPGHQACHVDLTTAYGIRYVWRGRVTSVIGQNVPARLRGLWQPRCPLTSARTLAREAAKQVLGRSGHGRYVMHGRNRVLRPIRLRDGHSVYEFLRCNPHRGGVSAGDTARGIGQVLTETMLQRLIDSGGICVLYTHLGKICSYERPFDSAAVAALQRLARHDREGRILVTTTQRLLRYCRALEETAFALVRHDGRTRIDVRPPADLGGGPASAGPLDGLTFYLPDGQVLPITIDGQNATHIQVNPPDHTGRRSVSFPWPRLEWPP